MKFMKKKKTIDRFVISGYASTATEEYTKENSIVTSDKDDEFAIPTELASSEKTTTIPVTTEKADTTSNLDGKISSSKTGDKGIILTRTIGLLTRVTALISKKKKK